MAVHSGIVCDHDGLLIGLEGLYRACCCKVYMFVCCVEAVEASFDAAADVVECILAALCELDVMFLVCMTGFYGEFVWICFVLFG